MMTGIFGFANFDFVADSTSGVSKDTVEGMIADSQQKIEESIQGQVGTAVDAKMIALEDEGKTNDIRTVDSLPASGIEDVQYIIKSTGEEYIWTDGAWKLVVDSERLDNESIEELFN